MKVVIFVEHVDRELKVAKSLSDLILKKYKANITVDIRSIYFHFWEIFLSKPDLVVFPSNWPILEDSCNFFINSNFVSLNYEQMLSKFNVDAKRPRGKKMVECVQHFSWTEDYTSYLLESGVPQDHITKTEKPSHFFLKSLILMKAKTKKELSITYCFPEKAKVVFLPLTCLQGFKDDVQLKKEFKDLDLYTRAVYRRDFVRNSLITIFEWISTLAKANPKVIFIFRPHPSVSVDQYINFFQKIELTPPLNLIVISEKTSNEWLVISDIVLSNYSSVLLDAQTIGVRSGILQPIEFPNDMRMDWFEKFEMLNSYDALSDFFGCALDHTNTCYTSHESGNGLDQTADKIVDILHSRSNGDSINQDLPRVSLALCFFTLKSTIRWITIKVIPFFIKKSMRRDYFGRNEK